MRWIAVNVDAEIRRALALPSNRIQLKWVDERMAKDFTMDKPASGRGLHPERWII